MATKGTKRERERFEFELQVWLGLKVTAFSLDSFDNTARLLDELDPDELPMII